jgi:hypothetical protein
MSTQIQGQSQREDRSHSPPFRPSAKVRYVKSRLTGNAAAANAYSVAERAALLSGSGQTLGVNQLHVCRKNRRYTNKGDLLVGAMGIGTSRLAEYTQLVEKYQPLETLKTLNWP